MWYEVGARVISSVKNVLYCFLLLNGQRLLVWTCPLATNQQASGSVVGDHSADADLSAVSEAVFPHSGALVRRHRGNAEYIIRVCAHHTHPKCRAAAPNAKPISREAVIAAAAIAKA